MAKLLKAFDDLDVDGQQLGLIIVYTVDGDMRYMFLSSGEIDGLSAAQIRALAQARANADTSETSSNERIDIVPDAIREARQWLKTKPATINLARDTPDNISAFLAGATEAQRLQALDFAVQMGRAFGLLFVDD